MTDIPAFTESVEQLLTLEEGIVWNCVWGLNPKNVDRKILQLMSQAGCKAIIMGIESGDDYIRKRCGKTDTVEEVRQSIELIRECGIAVHGFFLIGFPEESMVQMQRTIALAYSLPLEVRSLSICYPLPGSEYYQWVKRKYSIPRIDWSTFNIYRSPYPMSQVSSRRLSLIRRRVQLRNLLNPTRLRTEFKRGTISREVLKSKFKKMVRTRNQG